MKPVVIVTGGAGFIGSHLVERLLAEGNAVVVIDDCSTGRLQNLAAVNDHPDLKIIVARLSQCPDLATLVAGADSIFHLAAVVGVDLVMKSPVKTIEMNLAETQVILAAASRALVPILVTSTSEVYGKSREPEFSEADDLLIGPPSLSRWSYACSKLMDEFLALAYFREQGLPVIIARLFNIVGPRQTGHYGMVLPRFIAAAKRGEPLKVFGDGRQTRSFCYVTDTIEALIRLRRCAPAKGEIFNIGGSEEITIRALAEKVVRLLQSKSTLEIIPYDRAYPAGFEDMLRRKPLLAKLEQFIQFRPPTSLEQIIQQTAASIS
jgi:UDP-glucose 4-epimerase